MHYDHTLNTFAFGQASSDPCATDALPAIAWVVNGLVAGATGRRFRLDEPVDGSVERELAIVETVRHVGIGIDRWTPFGQVLVLLNTCKRLAC